MFFLISAGLRPEQLSLEALEKLKKCDEVFFDSYTSQYSEGSVELLESLSGQKILPLSRREIEEGFQNVLEKAKNSDIALLVVGNALFATTHSQLLLDAKEKKIPFRFIPGVSVSNYLGLTGLSSYRFGETVSIAMPEKNYAPESFYEKITQNYQNKMHSLCLLDLKENRLSGVKESLQRLLEIEKSRGKNLIKDAVLIVMSALGSSSQCIAVGKAEELLKKEFPLPACIIVCAELNENERLALKKLYRYCHEPC